MASGMYPNEIIATGLLAAISTIRALGTLGIAVQYMAANDEHPLIVVQHSFACGTLHGSPIGHDVHEGRRFLRMSVEINGCIVQWEEDVGRADQVARLPTATRQGGARI
jgi:hypothetical protein